MGDPTVKEVTAAIASSLHAIAEEATWEDVPGTDVYSCGNYRDHDLAAAKRYAKAYGEVLREWSAARMEYTSA